MKLATRDIPGFLNAPPANCRAVLLFGADEGLARQHRDRLVKAYGADKRDAFSYIEHHAATIAETPSRLHEDLSATSLMGDAPVVCVTDVSHKLAGIIEDTLNTPACSNPLILLAGELGKGALRTLFESTKRKDCAAIPCYRKEGRDLAVVIRQFLQSHNIQADSATMQLLQTLLGNDSAVTEQELEKIDLYLGDDRTLTQAVVHELLQDNQHHMLSDAALHWLLGNNDAFYTSIDELFHRGEHPVTLVRILANLTYTLLGMRITADEGTPIAQLVAYVYFKDKPRYTALLQRWNSEALLTLYHELQRLELEIKRTATPQTHLSQRLALYPRC